jgi:uncharacterized oligopeptide transporter (OPT) family protein
MGTPAYHVLLSLVAILILGPLGGISAAFMNFSIGFFIGGQVLAGILGSVVTLPYGPEGKHGANYMQTMASSVAGMCGMAVLVQAMSWMGLPEPATWKLVLYFLCIGMFGVGLGMLYTPLLVDKMQLAYPSGLAVANILRALTDKELLKRSIIKLGGGMGLGFGGGLFSSLGIPWVDALGLSTSTLGAGMIVGARIAIPALVVGFVGELSRPHLVSIGWLEADAPFRKIGFIIALGTILGAALVDIVLILIQAARRLGEKRREIVPPAEDWKRVNNLRLALWVVFWGAALVLVGSLVLGQPLKFLLVAVLLCFLFVLVNGIAQGISDSNPISSAFVMTVFILASLGLRDPGVGLMCASVLLIACSEGGDMQQDRSTGWRLGTNRIIQFRYQVIGIAMGAVLAVVLAKLFMNAYPVLKLSQYGQHVEGAAQWQSAMTYKFVGALKEITNPKGHIMTALWLGVGLGVLTEGLRKLLKLWRAYWVFVRGSVGGKVLDFLLDAVVLPSPYASSFGGFVEIATLYWWAGGGVLASLFETWQERKKAAARDADEAALPSDMSTMSLAGGGLIAGDSLAALSLGVFGLLKTLLGF